MFQSNVPRYVFERTFWGHIQHRFKGCNLIIPNPVSITFSKSASEKIFNEIRIFKNGIELESSWTQVSEHEKSEASIQLAPEFTIALKSLSIFSHSVFFRFSFAKIFKIILEVTYDSDENAP